MSHRADRPGRLETEYEAYRRSLEREPLRVELSAVYSVRFNYGQNLFNGNMLDGQDALSWLRLQFLKAEDEGDIQT